MGELRDGAGELEATPRVKRAAEALAAVHARLDAADTPAVAPAVVAEPAPMSNSGPEVVEGEDLTLVVDMRRCIHSRFCVTGAPKTFIANVEGPWLHPDETAAGLLMEIAHACPSGAIGYRGKNGRPDEGAPQVNMLRVRENGPNAIHAPLVVAGKPDGYRATFCRCGQSKNKPYCDGTHHEVGFAASGEPETISLDALEVRDGPLLVDPQRNGPLRVTGNLEICAGTGRVVKRVQSVNLCRCGHSQNKPFCDGSHRAAGFEADGV
ncbi:MAG: CDGSH iron-sulfur domain-containing protein [Asticcacaulis sp.]|nr:CDGSH iron-sulfur domain-containing protein [Asticcacaulis sp.]